MKTGEFQITRTFLLALGLTLAATGLLAQEPNPYSGTWLGTYTTKKGEQRSAVLNLSDDGGTWKNHVRVRQDTCLGRELPVTIVRATATQLVIRVHGSKFMPGCKDFGLKFSRTGENTFEGKMGKAGALTFVRQ